MRQVTIRQALQHVADNPDLETDDIISMKVHELVSRNLFDIANGANMSERGSMSRANIARKMIFDRLVGKRKPGSHPATRKQRGIEFHDLTGEGS
jgi:hypothetical protein